MGHRDDTRAHYHSESASFAEHATHRTTRVTHPPVPTAAANRLPSASAASPALRGAASVMYRRGGAAMASAPRPKAVPPAMSAAGARTLPPTKPSVDNSTPSAAWNSAAHASLAGRCSTGSTTAPSSGAQTHSVARSCVVSRGCQRQGSGCYAPGHNRARHGTGTAWRRDAATHRSLPPHACDCGAHTVSVLEHQHGGARGDPEPRANQPDHALHPRRRNLVALRLAIVLPCQAWRTPRPTQRTSTQQTQRREAQVPGRRRQRGMPRFATHAFPSAPPAPRPRCPHPPAAGAHACRCCPRPSWTWLAWCERRSSQPAPPRLQ